jgi:hypothetical protein
MKKILLIIIFLLTISSVQALDVGKIIEHFDFNNGSYTGNYAHTWANASTTNTSVMTIISNSSCLGLGSCMAFSSKGGYLQINNLISNLNRNKGAMTMWVYLTSINSVYDWFFEMADEPLTNAKYLRMMYNTGGDLADISSKLGGAFVLQINGNKVLTAGKWYLLTMVQDGSKARGYVNLTSIASAINTTGTTWWDDVYALNPDTLSIGGTPYDPAYSVIGYIDEITFWDEDLNMSEITEIFNGGAGINLSASYTNSTPEPTPAITYNANTTSDNTISYNQTSNNIYVSATINEFADTNTTIYLISNDTIYSSTVGTGNISYNFTGLPENIYKFYVQARNTTTSINTSNRTSTIYKIGLAISSPTSYQNVNKTLSITYTLGSIPSVSTFNGINITLLNNDGSLNRTIDGSTINTTYNLNLYNLSLNKNTYKIRITTTDNRSNSQAQTQDFNMTRDAEINVTIKYILDNTSITNFTMNITDLSTGEQETSNNPLEIIQGRNYNITVDAPGYAITSINQSFNQSYNNLTIYVYTENSVTINIRDTTTNLFITENITIIFTQNLTEITNTTTTGTSYISNLAEGTWIVKFYGTSYTLATYTITVGNRSTQTLNAYLTQSNDTTIFTIMDYDTGRTLEGATITQSKLINGSYTTINVKESDITGRAQLSYIPNTNYQFLVTITGYENNLFYLNPVLFNTYNIRLTKTTTLTEPTTPDYTGIEISYYNNLTGAATWINNATNTLIWIISSPIGSIENYNLTITHPTGNEIRTGNLAIGEQFTIPFNITGANASSQIIIAYCYKSTTSYNKCFNFPYPIIGSYDNTSMIANKDRTYGLSVIERVLIVTIVTFMVAGIVFTIGGYIPGLLVSLMIMGFFMTIGFSTIWMNLPSLFIGFIIIARGGKE